jgi:hypothetical protein
LSWGGAYLCALNGGDEACGEGEVPELLPHVLDGCVHDSADLDLGGHGWWWWWWWCCVGGCCLLGAWRKKRTGPFPKKGTLRRPRHSRLAAPKNHHSREEKGLLLWSTRTDGAPAHLVHQPPPLTNQPSSQYRCPRLSMFICKDVSVYMYVQRANISSWAQFTTTAQRWAGMGKWVRGRKRKRKRVLLLRQRPDSPAARVLAWRNLRPRAWSCPRTRHPPSTHASKQGSELE